MDTQSTLSVAAEVGIGVAGFSSIATAVLSRPRADQIEVSWIQVRTLLLTSLAIVALSYLPMALGASSLSRESIWFTVSFVYAAWVLSTLIIYLGGYRTLSSQAGHKRVLANLVLALALTSLTLNCLNMVIVRDSWPYLAALGCGILVTFSQFISLVRTFWDTEEPTRE